MVSKAMNELSESYDHCSACEEGENVTSIYYNEL